jgi:hypothetical protein
MADKTETPKINNRIEDLRRVLKEVGYRHLLSDLPLPDLNVRELFSENSFKQSPKEEFISLNKPSEVIFNDISGIILRKLFVSERELLDKNRVKRIWQIGECPLFFGKEKLGNMVFSYNKDLKMLKAQIPVSETDVINGDESEILDCLRDNFGKPIYDNRIGPKGSIVDVLAWGSDSDMIEAGCFAQALCLVYPEKYSEVVTVK